MTRDKAVKRVIQLIDLFHGSSSENEKATAKKQATALCEKFTISRTEIRSVRGRPAYGSQGASKGTQSGPKKSTKRPAYGSQGASKGTQSGPKKSTKRPGSHGRERDPSWWRTKPGPQTTHFERGKWLYTVAKARGFDLNLLSSKVRLKEEFKEEYTREFGWTNDHDFNSACIVAFGLYIYSKADDEKTKENTNDQILFKDFIKNHKVYNDY